MAGTQDLTTLFRAELALCKVGPGEAVAVLSEAGGRRDYAEAFLAAARALGAEATVVDVPAVDAASGARHGLVGNRPAIDALKRVDMVIDMVGLLWSPEQTEITDAGTRMLLVKEPPDILARMFPTEDLRRRVEASARRLAAARELRIASAAGTDVIYRLGGYAVLDEYGYTEAPGRWDHWPSGFSATGAHDDGVDGTVVLDRGDIFLSSTAAGARPFRGYVDHPVALTIENGMVTRIDGDGRDADRLIAFFESYDDPRAYAVSHIGWGMNENAQWDYLAKGANRGVSGGMDGRSAYGNVLFSTGPNTEIGGDNDTPCHLDIPLAHCDLWLDGERILDAGEAVPAELRAAGR
jgi:2,5-dihydroxypyridine 5,6-dioxygenase